MNTAQSAQCGPDRYGRHSSGVWLALGLTLSLALPATAQTPIGDTTADRVLGQLDFSRNGVNLVDGRGLDQPGGVAIDRSVNPNRVYVADSGNNRVLAWRNADSWANGDTADVVIGQPDFASNASNNGGVTNATLRIPGGLAVDGAGNLYVADTGNHRVLRYDSPLATGDLLADLVIGQADMSSRTANPPGAPTAISLRFPAAVAVDGNGHLYVADRSNGRVLRYAPPQMNGMAASQFFGQPDFTTAGNNTGGRSASSLSVPSGLAVDAVGNLYVADSGNNRVLQYNTPVSAGNVADRVFGQADMMSAASPNPPTPTSLNGPSGLALSPAGDQLYVADNNNNRVLRFVLPAAGNGPVANLVLGQTDFSGGGAAVSATRMRNPIQLAVDTAGNLYVAEEFNHRVTFFSVPSSNGQAASRVLGQTSLNGRGINLPEGQGFNQPSGVAVDTSVTPNRVYVADRVNSRVLAWRDVTAFANGASADLVIGQLDFNGTDSATANNRLNFPQGLVVDGAGNLYVADSNNHRVLRFDTPLNPGGDQVADLVLGQPNFVSSGSSNASNGMNGPFGLGLNASGQLHVADLNNDRVLIFQPPFSNGDAAAVVLALAGLAFPLGIAIDANDNLYVSQFSQDNVLRFNAPVQNTSPVSAMIGTGSGPAGLAIDAFGHLYVVERFNNRLVQYENPLLGHNDLLPDLVFGSAGAPSAVTLNFPVFVAVDGSGNVYVSDDGDHRVLEFASPLAADFGDAPTGYGTLQANNGARHRKGGPLLGLAVDLEDDGLPQAAGATGDDANANPDDEDGVTIGNLAIGETVGVSVVSSAAANLNAWVDLNGDGDFGDAGEQLLTDVTTAAGQQTLNLVIPGSATAGASFARFRLSSAAGTGALGIAADGEVEDYAVTLGNRPTLTTPANQTTAEDTPITALAVTVGDTDSGAAGLTLTATSSNTALIPNANLVTGGSNANRTLTITPAANQNGGPVTITLTVSDGTFSAQTSFTVTVTAVNDPPTLTNPGGLVVAEDAAAQTVNLAGISGGPADEAQAVTITVSSNNVALIPTPTVNYTSPAATGSLSFTPVANQNGVATITVTVNDGAGANNTLVQSFLVTVSPVNDPPTLGAIANPAAINEDAAAQTVNFGGIGTGQANEADTLTVTATSSNTALIPNPTVTYTSPAATGSLSYTPVADANGTATITVTVNDGGPINNTATQSFSVTVNPINDPPTLSQPANVQFAENLAGQSVNLSGISNGPADEAGPLQLSAVSSNTALLPNPTVAYTSPGATATLNFAATPTDAIGSSTITVTVTDAGGLSTSQSFTMRVLDVPQLSPSADQTMLEDGVLAVGVTLSDADEVGNLSNLVLTAVSSNPALIPPSAVTLGGSAGSRTLSLRPLPDQNGQSTITLTVTDPQGLTATDSFNLTVTPVNDPPVAQPQAINAISGNDVSGQLLGSDPDGDTLSYELARAPTRGAVLIQPDGRFSYTPGGTTSGTDSFDFRVRDASLASAPAVVNVTVRANNAGGGGGGFANSPSNPTTSPSPTPPPPATGGPSPTPAPQPDQDVDGAGDGDEASVGDGNGDGIADNQQSTVASLVNTRLADVNGGPGQSTVTVALVDGPTQAAPATAVLRNVQVRSRNAVAAPPAGVDLPSDLLSFDITGLQGSSTASVELILGAIGQVPNYNSYYKFGPRTPGAAPEFYEFLFDGETGAQFSREIRSINGSSREVLVMTLTFRDGGRGDSDQLLDGRISDPGAPAIVADVDERRLGGSSGSLGGWMLLLLAAGLGGLRRRR